MSDEQVCGDSLIVKQSTQSTDGGSTPASPLHSIVRLTDPALRRIARNFVDSHHSYIKWADRPSRKMYWTLYEDGNLVGVFGLGSAFARPKAIQQYMKQHNWAFNEVANNIVYCLYGNRDKNAGSKFLRLIRKDAVKWWKERYGDDLRAFQTFILPPRTGAVYMADNWEKLGSTTGGKTMTVRTLYGDERKLYPNAERRVFKSGEVKYLLRTFMSATPKIIFMRAAKVKRMRRIAS